MLLLPAPAEQVVAALTTLAAAARPPGDDRTLGGRGCQDHSAVGGGAPAGWNFWKMREGRGGGACFDLEPDPLRRGRPAA